MMSPVLVWGVGLAMLGIWVERHILVRIDWVADAVERVSREGAEAAIESVPLMADEFDLLDQGVRRIRRSLRVALRLLEHLDEPVRPGL